MKTLNWYVTRGFLVAFFMAIGILTFAMTGANLIKVMNYMSQGVSFWTFCEFTLYILPIVLTFTVPWAVMVAVMLVFGRLSADSEITAMRACGVSILQIVSPIMLITVLLTALCLYMQVELGPPLLGKSRNMMDVAVINQPLALFEPGKQIQLENHLLYIDDKEGKNIIKGVQLYILKKASTEDRRRNKSQEVLQDVSAKTGEVFTDKENQVLVVRLYDCMIEDKNRRDGEGVQRMYAEKLEFKYYYGQRAQKEKLSVKPKYMRLADLMGRIRLTKEINKDTTELEVEMNQRIAFALSPIAFLLLGLPLAIRTNRRETSIGLFLSVILAGVFFLAIILCESFCSFPWLYPQYLLWLPNIIYQIAGAVMTYRISQR